MSRYKADLDLPGGGGGGKGGGEGASLSLTTAGLPGMPSAKKPHFDKTSFRLLQNQQSFLETTIGEDEKRRQMFETQASASAPIDTPAELQQVHGELSKLDACFAELSQVMDSYAPRVATMAATVWARQQTLVSRLKKSLRHHMTLAQKLQGRQDALDERNERLTNQTKRSLGIMNSDVQKLETELIQTDCKLQVATKLNESLQGELARLREQVQGVGAERIATGASFYEMNREFESGLNQTEASMVRACVRGCCLRAWVLRACVRACVRAYAVFVACDVHTGTAHSLRGQGLLFCWRIPHASLRYCIASSAVLPCCCVVAKLQRHGVVLIAIPS